jgi:hypothetical protein
MTGGVEVERATLVKDAISLPLLLRSAHPEAVNADECLGD